MNKPFNYFISKVDYIVISICVLYYLAINFIAIVDSSSIIGGSTFAEKNIFHLPIYYTLEKFFPILISLIIGIAYYKDFSHSTPEFMLTMPVKRTSLVFTKYIYIMSIYIVFYILSVINLTIATNTALSSYKYTTLNVFEVFFKSFPVSLFLTSLVAFGLVVFKNSIYTIAVYSGLYIFESLSQGILTKQMQLFITYQSGYVSSIIYANRIIYTVLSIMLIYFSYVVMNSKKYLSI